jgi:predicted  nucleic acid-binding Zn-ribbon protein
MSNPELTAEQKKNLVTWAEERDAILVEISILKTENENLQKVNKDLANSNSDIEARMNEIRGRIEELRIKESELPLVISKEVSFLQSKKNTLESEITSLSKIVEILTSQKTSLEADVSFALSEFDVIKGETLLLDKVVDRVTAVSQNNANKIDTLVNDLAKSLEEIIEVNRKNVFETNIVIDKVPKMIMEAQKHGLIKNKI